MDFTDLIERAAPHTWEYCSLCGITLICAICGNGCCNGGTGELENGDPCGCNEAYKQYMNALHRMTVNEHNYFEQLLEKKYKDVISKTPITPEQRLLIAIFGESDGQGNIHISEC